jgi:hypothetical protein
MRLTIGLGESTWMEGRYPSRRLGSCGIPPTPRDECLESGIVAARDVETLLGLLARRSDTCWPICVALILLPPADSTEGLVSTGETGAAELNVVLSSPRPAV